MTSITTASSDGAICRTLHGDISAQCPGSYSGVVQGWAPVFRKRPLFLEIAFISHEWKYGFIFNVD